MEEKRNEIIAGIKDNVEQDLKTLNDEYQKAGGAEGFKLNRAQRRLLAGKRKKRL